MSTKGYVISELIAITIVCMLPKPLTIDEIPESLREYFILTDQISIRKATHVKILCPYCGNERYIEVSDFRRRTYRYSSYRLCRCRKSKPLRICIVEGCEKAAKTRDRCDTHYSYARRNGQIERLDGKKKSPEEITKQRIETKRKRRIWYVEKYKTRTAMLNQIKLQFGCIDCGYKDHPVALHFDHRDPSMKSFQIGLGWSFEMERLLAEIDKCDVRCANCHSIRTYTEGHHSLNHGPY